MVTASHGGDISSEDLRAYLQAVQVDFISPHRPRDPKSPAQTQARTEAYLAATKEAGRLVPLHYQEPFRRGYGKWEPKAGDYVADLRGALAGGAAGWCFHNGAQRDTPAGEPRRCFDLRARSLFDALDTEERETLQRLRALVR